MAEGPVHHMYMYWFNIVCVLFVVGSDMVCVREDRVYKNGEQWQKDRCTTCTCKNGLMFCRAMAHSCPVPVDSCSWMVVPEGECCPVCKGKMLPCIHTITLF